MEHGDRARDFHQATKHSYESVRRSGRLLDWERKPDPFKRYRGLRRTSLPRLDRFPPVPTPEALRPGPGREAKVSAAVLGSLLWLGAGAHRRRRFGEEEVLFRTYASAGALYPNEVYAAVGDLDGLPAGCYHLDPAEPALTRLRDRDPRPHLARAAGGLPAVAEAQAIVVLSGIPWRSGWKYGERGYRHLWWDGGMIVANLLAAASAVGVPAAMVTGFVDADLEALLGLHPPREVPLSLVALGRGRPVEPADDAPEPAGLEVAPGSAGEEEFPLAREAHDAGRLRDPEEVRAWREAPPEAAAAPRPDSPRPSLGEARDPIDRVILRRGSARGFVPSTMPSDVLGAILEAGAGVPASDVAPPPAHTFVAAHAVEDLPSGSYRFRDGRLESLREGEFRRKAAFLCLEQRLGGEGAATTFLLGELEAALGAWGDRGYRVLQLAAGVGAGRMYLAAYGLGWGASGLTFYDDEVTRFFEPAAARMEPLLVVAVGESVGRSDLRPAR